MREEDRRSITYHDKALEKAKANEDALEHDPRALRWTRDHDHDSQARMICSVLNSDAEVIYDIGCGYGEVAHLLATKYRPNAKIVGVELHPDFFSACQERFKHVPNLTFLNASYWDVLDAKPASIQWVISTGGLWEYCPEVNLERLWWMIVRVTGRGMIYNYDRRQTIFSRVPALLDKLKTHYPNIDCSQNLKIKEARARGLEGKIKPIIYGAVTYFDKGSNASIFTGEIPPHVDLATPKINHDDMKLF